MEGTHDLNRRVPDVVLGLSDQIMRNKQKDDPR
jgi:hypothetical protein